ncbi:hypothetical protein HO133_007189 [Letharia lupina]|uniref:O-methyltransferase C-terminal domain-containing protein n=1 Tax=Letharia lupina TaxID=560253 RepID=A0A8H6FIC1_9LECA|nr:uncharacterized protein HO133_007189 [Letharia lupina]KAF6229075.1 hypothetical protein HO133_007189 [Letharia lupina]
MASSRILELSSIIATNTERIDGFLTSHGFPYPTFEIDAPLQAIVHFDIASSVPRSGRATFGQISSSCGLTESDTRQLLRHAMTNYIFQEPEKGYVSHTASSVALVDVPMMGRYVEMVSSELWPTATTALHLTTKIQAFNVANHTNRPFYEEIARFPDRASRFAVAMDLINASESMKPIHVVENYDWAGLKENAVVIDIGGSHGQISIALATKFPHLRCIVQDIKGVIAEGKDMLPEHLNGRVMFMEHDFFTEQPVKNADIYFFRWVFHNWSDKYCIKILRSLIPALKKGASVVINEFCIADPGMIPLHKEKELRSYDLGMKSLFNSKERESEDWENLLKIADRRFLFKGARVPAGSSLAIIEACWDGDGQ